MKPVWKYILISFFTVLVLGYIGYALWYNSGRDKDLICKQLNIVLTDKHDRNLITEQEIAVLLDHNGLNPIGKLLRDINTESIEKLIRKNPMVKTAECFTSPDGTVNVEVSQRIPKFRVIGWASYYIDEDRKLMPVSLNTSAYVPVVSGIVTVSMAEGPLFDFISYLEQHPFWNNQIEQINLRYDRKIELVPRVGNAIILLGTLDNYESKLDKLRKLYVYGFNKIGWNRYRLIDLEYQNQVVCTKAGKNESGNNKPVVSKDSIITRKL